MPPPEFRSYYFQSAGWCPNNPGLPLGFYQEVHAGEPEELAKWFEKLFMTNGWPPAWRYTIFDYPHFHSNTHEVVAVFRGHALVRFGDTTGKDIECSPGDAILIPAGVSHQRLKSTADFTVVRAYPRGFEPDEIRPSNPLPDAALMVAAVPVPERDPIFGCSERVSHTSSPTSHGLDL